MFNLLLPVLIASTPTGLLDCETYNWLIKDMKFPDVTPELKQEIVETMKDGTDPACFK
jgi:hypothetical protein